MSKIVDSYQHLLYDLTATLREDLGYPEAFAMLISDGICEGLARRHGRSEFYIPTSPKERRDAMYQAIYMEFNGDNMFAVCKKYGISQTTVYRAIAEAARARRESGSGMDMSGKED